MKKYEKPLYGKISYPPLASLSSWLSQNELTEAGITTYLVHS